MNKPNSLRIQILTELRQFRQDMAAMTGELVKVKKKTAEAFDTRQFEAGFGRMKTALAGLAGVLSARSAVVFLKDVISETGKAEGQLAQLRAALESTGQAAGFNQLQLMDMAQQMAVRLPRSSTIAISSSSTSLR